MHRGKFGTKELLQTGYSEGGILKWQELKQSVSDKGGN